MESGLADLLKVIKEHNITSVAIPPLGAGLGGLYWPDVKNLIYKAFEKFPEIEVLLYEPVGPPKVNDQPQKIEKKIKMTKGRALLLALMNLYKGFGYRHTQLEAQKIMYFMKESGEIIERLQFKKHKFGPYSDGLRHALKKMEGHYITGFGDGTQISQIEILDGALKEAHLFLNKNKDTLERLKIIEKLIDGFETPYGLELLATVHWSVIHDNFKNLDEVITNIQSWNKRKKELMKESHIESAYHHLKELGWLKAS